MANLRCMIPDQKIKGYLLNPRSIHAAEFFNVGYSEKSAGQLKRDIERQYSFEKATDFQIGHENSEKFSIFMILGIKEKKRFRTVWQKDSPDAVPRLITVYREG